MSDGERKSILSTRLAYKDDENKRTVAASMLGEIGHQVPYSNADGKDHIATLRDMMLVPANRQG